MNDVVIGAIGGYQFSQIKNWIYSLNSTSFDGDRIMLCYGCSKELVDQIKENGFEVFDFQPWEMEHDGDIFHRASVSFYKK